MTLSLVIMLGGWLAEVIFGWPDWLYRLIRHPVVWLGSFITALERRFNQDTASPKRRARAGGWTTGLVVGAAIITAWAITHLPLGVAGSTGVQILLASSLLASRSLYDHVLDVAAPLAQGRLDEARAAVAMIVGRDSQDMAETEVATAALESLAENTSDGVIAPLFWGCVFGLPGLAAYKAINTLDSMIGHKSERYLAFGAVAARLDDAANYVPARLTGLVFALAAASKAALRAMRGDAGQHASPNAGWPEAAMAGALDVRLGGPRRYTSGAKSSHAPWMNEGGRRPMAADIIAGVQLYVRALSITAAALTAVLLWRLA